MAAHRFFNQLDKELVTWEEPSNSEKKFNCKLYNTAEWCFGARKRDFGCWKKYLACDEERQVILLLFEENQHQYDLRGGLGVAVIDPTTCLFTQQSTAEEKNEYASFMNCDDDTEYEHQAWSPLTPNRSDDVGKNYIECDMGWYDEIEPDSMTEINSPTNTLFTASELFDSPGSFFVWVDEALLKLQETSKLKFTVLHVKLKHLYNDFLAQISSRLNTRKSSEYIEKRSNGLHSNYRGDIFWDEGNKANRLATSNLFKNKWGERLTLAHLHTTKKCGAQLCMPAYKQSRQFDQMCEPNQSINEMRVSGIYIEEELSNVHQTLYKRTNEQGEYDETQIKMMTVMFSQTMTSRHSKKSKSQPTSPIVQTKSSPQDSLLPLSFIKKEWDEMLRSITQGDFYKVSHFGQSKQPLQFKEDFVAIQINYFVL